MPEPRNAHGRFETRAVHAGWVPDRETGAVMPPIYYTSTYLQDGPAELRGGHDYSRSINPTRTAMEENLAALEGGSWGLGFSSGMAACNALLDTLETGDHVVAGNDLYGGTYRIFTKVFQRFGVRFSFVDTTDASAVAAAIEERTKLVYIETPTNPLLRITDIRAVCEAAHARGARVCVDNTFATPYLQRPLELGADIVLHSLTKYLGGHSDVVAGALIGRDEQLREQVTFYQNAVGGTPGAMDCFLVLRGTKTLHLRMDRHCANAARVAEFLEGHDLVERVIYPGLPSHPQYELAQRQMSQPGGMVAFELSGGVEAANAFAKATKVFTLAESLGGVESLVEVPPSMTHASIPAEVRRAAGLADGLVRLSVGVENVEDLVEDVASALATAPTASAVGPAIPSEA